MSTAVKPKTPAQGLHDMRQHALRMLVNFAEATKHFTSISWRDPARREKAVTLIGYIKRDLTAYHQRLDRLVSKTDNMPGKVLAHPHHPEMLQLGGEYMMFIDDATAVITPLLGSLTELADDDLPTE